ncbi:unnamed protein product [Polarella glacialis]|uniref:Tetratricopeptide repeat protein n=1 Tax=Polarella glacialis TaxID=89957 RepID=A0A813KKY7_POLGL|nr:unnamed protein product [Polarella glacialis]
MRLLARCLLSFVVLSSQPGRCLLSAAAKIDEEPELAVDQVRQEAILEVKFAEMKSKYGVDDRRTLHVFFELFDLWIMLYRLNKADKALAEILPACEWRRDDLSIKAVQALAFTRWKQGRFREALARFHEMEGWLGKNPALAENIGHTYNALGEHGEAEAYFQQALQLISETPAAADSNKGGILLGLAGIRDKRGQLAEALSPAQDAYNFYKARDQERGWESSLTAKAAMQLSKIHLQMGEVHAAERKTREAIRLFQSTSGEDTPLLSGAFSRLGEALVMQDRRSEAWQAFRQAYEIEAIKDAFDLTEIVILHNKLVDTHLGEKGGLDRAAFEGHFPVLHKVLNRVRRLPQDSNAGAYYKLAGELFVLGANCQAGRPLLLEAVRLLADERSVDTSGMIRQSVDLVAYCDGTYKSE